MLICWQGVLLIRRMSGDRVAPRYYTIHDFPLEFDFYFVVTFWNNSNLSEKKRWRLENIRSKLPSQEKKQPVDCETTCLQESKMVALETFGLSQSDASFDLYAVYSQTGVTGVRSDRVDLLNTQVTLRGHCTTHVLRDRQLAANHPSTVLSREGEKIKPLKRFILSGRSRCRGFDWRAAAFSRSNLPLISSKPREGG